MKYDPKQMNALKAKGKKRAAERDRSRLIKLATFWILSACASLGIVAGCLPQERTTMADAGIYVVCGPIGLLFVSFYAGGKHCILHCNGYEGSQP